MNKIIIGSASFMFTSCVVYRLKTNIYVLKAISATCTIFGLYLALSVGDPQGVDFILVSAMVTLFVILLQTHPIASLGLFLLSSFFTIYSLLPMVGAVTPRAD